MNIEPKGNLMQAHKAASHIASPRADSVFVGQCLSVVRCPLQICAELVVEVKLNSVLQQCGHSPWKQEGWHTHTNIIYAQLI